jgi:hypothetical protein
MFNAIDFVSANEMLAITATTSPRSGNVMREVAAPMTSFRHGVQAHLAPRADVLRRDLVNAEPDEVIEAEPQIARLRAKRYLAP